MKWTTSHNHKSKKYLFQIKAKSELFWDERRKRNCYRRFIWCLLFCHRVFFQDCAIYVIFLWSILVGLCGQRQQKLILIEFYAFIRCLALFAIRWCDHWSGTSANFHYILLQETQEQTTQIFKANLGFLFESTKKRKIF